MDNEQYQEAFKQLMNLKNGLEKLNKERSQEDITKDIKKELDKSLNERLMEYAKKDFKKYGSSKND